MIVGYCSYVCVEIISTCRDGIVYRLFFTSRGEDMLKFDGKKEVAKIGLSLAHPLLIPCSFLAQSEDVEMLMDFVS